MAIDIEQRHGKIHVEMMHIAGMNNITGRSGEEFRLVEAQKGSAGNNYKFSSPPRKMTRAIHQSLPLALHWVVVWLHGGPKLIGMSGGGGGGGPGIHIGGPGGLGMGMGADILQRGDQTTTVFPSPSRP